MEDFLARLDEQIYRQGGSWGAFLVRALWRYKSGVSRNEVLDIVLEDALARGRKVPRTFEQVLQRVFQNHNSEAAGFRGASTDDIFKFVGGKGSGVWGLHHRKALIWMASNGRECDFTIAED